MNESDQHQHARIKDEAAGWVVKLNSGRLSGDDAYAFEVWLHENGDHRREFAAHARVWQGAATATERPGDADPISVRRVVAAWAKAHPIRATIRLVGSCLAILAVAFVVDRHLEPPLEHLAAHTEIGQSKRVELADGSTVQLNTDSGITADYSSEERAVKLEKGEAHFVVAHRRDWPFRVYTGDHMIEALGTAFRVFVGEQTEVTVTEGQVRLVLLEALRDSTIRRDARTDAIVRAGRNAVFRLDGILVEPIKEAAINRRLAWREGGLAFDGEPLSAVVREFARYSATPITLAEDIREVKVLGWFPVGDTPQFIRALEDNVNIAALTNTDGSIYLYPKSPTD